MGLALEWMSADEREAAARELLPEAGKKNRRLVARCPFHAEKTPSFGYDPEKDLFHCFGCGAGGDLIKLYAELRGGGRDSKDVFREFKARYGPEDENGRPRRRRRPSVRPAGWRPSEAPWPPEVWSEKAGLFVEHSIERLRQRPREMEQLRHWGLDTETVARGRLGWNDRWKVFPGRPWGLPDDVEIKLAPGLVIPLFERGRVIRIKIRRAEAAVGPRYWQVKGSSTRLYLYGRAERIMVVETERDALMLWGKFGRGGDWAFCGIGSASARPCALVHPILSAARLLAVSLDGDQAGARGWNDFWRREYPGALWWPMPEAGGKDPGEAAERGYDLAAWISAAENYIEKS